jgi:phosphate starvation-inducible protein PhoH and related proteins
MAHTSMIEIGIEMSEPVQRSLTLDSREEAVILFGPRDSYLKSMRDAIGAKIVSRGDFIQIEGNEDQVTQTERAIKELRSMLRKSGKLTGEDIKVVLEVVTNVAGPNPGNTNLAASDGGKFTRPRTDGQGRYVTAMKQNDVVICVGPAGTGKTYLAVGWAATLLRTQQVKKIILVRPAVEAGERLGYLPGDFIAKVNPYLRPLFDALNDIIDPEQVKRFMEADIIEIVPLAYMRGRTLNQACIILDEGQNATVSQMKMFLTRMGHGSKIVVTGDMTQTDLPTTVKSGLIDAVQRLRDIQGISIVHLDEADIVRNPLVQKIVKAYEEEERKRRV